MKKSNIFYTILILTLFFGGCKGKSDSASKEETLDKDASYALGMSMGMFINSRFVTDGIIPNQKQFIMGIKDTLSGKKTRFSEDEADQKIQEAINAIMEKRMSEMENGMNESKQEGIDFLVENGKKPGIKTTSSGLQYEVIKEGTGKKPSATDMVKVHYEGKLIDGVTFDSSYGSDPIQFPLEGVIAGWAEGLQLMSVGSKYRLYIPSELGYGARGAGPIPPYSVLIFDVELLDIVK